MPPHEFDPNQRIDDFIKGVRGTSLGMFAGGVIGAAVVMAILISADVFSGILTPLYRYSENYAVMRVGTVLLFGGLGFGLGWFISPQAKAARVLIAGVLTGIVLAVLIADHGVLGWGVASVGGWIAFAVGFGYWTRQAIQRFREPPTTFGNAKWANFDHLSENDAIGTDGFRLGDVHDANGDVKPLHYASDRHMLTFAPTRSGKGTSMIIPNLLSYEGSVLVIDPKGENALVTAEHRQKMGHEVHVVDPWAVTASTDLPTARFNPLEWLVPGDPDMTENAMLLADALVVPNGNGDAFWTEEAKALLQGLILYVATDEDEKGQRHLGRVRDLLLLDEEGLQTLFKKMLGSSHHIVASTGARSLQKEEKLRANVIASAQAETHFLDSTRIRESLSSSDFSFEDLKAKKVAIYLVLPSDRLNAFGRWLRLLIQQALTVNARNLETKPEKPVLFLLDEFAALGRLNMVEQAFGLMAGYSLQLWGIVQDASQLKRIYGEGWETFISNAGVLQYFGSRDRMTAEYFSALCGVTTVWNFSTAVARAFGKSTGGTGGSSTSSNESFTDTTSAAQRKLAYADELMRIHKSRQIVLIENLDPIRASRRPWYEDVEFKTSGRNLHAA